MGALKLYLMGTLDKMGLVETFFSRATYVGTRLRSPEASEKYRQRAQEAAEKVRQRQAARLERTA